MVKQSHDPGQDLIKPGGCIGKPGGKEGQNHVHGDLGVDDVACGAGEFFPEANQAVAGRAQKGSEKDHAENAEIVVGVVK